jgi:hypothetical protein
VMKNHAVTQSVKVMTTARERDSDNLINMILILTDDKTMQSKTKYIKKKQKYNNLFIK